MFVFFFKQKTAYEMRISDWSSDVCSSDLEGKDYFRLGAISVSASGKLLAYAVDDNGSERFTARIKNLETGELLPDEIPGTLSSLVWVAQDKALVYSLANEQWRTDNARLHWLGGPLEKDVELYHEDDEGFRVGSSLSANEKWLGRKSTRLNSS